MKKMKFLKILDQFRLKMFTNKKKEEKYKKNYLLNFNSVITKTTFRKISLTVLFFYILFLRKTKVWILSPRQKHHSPDRRWIRAWKKSNAKRKSLLELRFRSKIQVRTNKFSRLISSFYIPFQRCPVRACTIGSDIKVSRKAHTHSDKTLHEYKLKNYWASEKN